MSTERRPYSILLVDNDPDFLETRAEFLEEAGYRVIKAHTPEQARHLLVTAHIHLAILDIRLVNDDDEKDTTGLTVAKDSTYELIPKIILTNFPSYQDVREALGPAIDGLPPAIDFRSKQEGPQIMIQAVEQAIAKYVRLNTDLDIQSDHREGLFLYLVGLLQPDPLTETLLHRADELKDLFRQLFHDYRQIRVGTLFWHDRQRFCLPVLAQSPQGVLDPRILLCGERNQLEREVEHLLNLAPDTFQGAKFKMTRSVHFGAATYVLPTTNLEAIQSLRQLFGGSKERPLKVAFDHVIEVLATWHQQGQRIVTNDLMLLYRGRIGLEEPASRLEVEHRLAALVQAVRPLNAIEVEYTDQSLVFHLSSQATLICPNPIATIYTPIEYDRPIVCKTSPGQITADNILVDIYGRQTWLTDFAYAGYMPNWWDFVCLEAIVRFELSQAPDLIAWQDLEECLVKPSRLDGPLPEREVVADLRKSLVLIGQIRRSAYGEIGHYDPLPYYAGLLVWVIGIILHHDPNKIFTQVERIRGAHLLLAAGMLAHRLHEPFDSPSPGGKLRFDEDEVVWLGNNKIELFGQELKLFRCLYQQPGKLVGREEIVETVFDEKYEAGDYQLDGRINALVRRLRLRIEPNPDNPRYLLMVKGQGYRLQIE
ncbi:MAG: winged helix-turn-helix domain-containing protein [Anaerolineae bacterium]|nr:winged helix-turn-helix domain-containing protein [Anaerolineae bacterium]